MNLECCSSCANHQLGTVSEDDGSKTILFEYRTILAQDGHQCTSQGTVNYDGDIVAEGGCNALYNHFFDESTLHDPMKFYQHIELDRSI